MARIEDLKGLVSKSSGIAKGNIYRVFLPSMPRCHKQRNKSIVF